ncbi:fungal-specific transcription factor domain-containing protein [Lipomyces oligophaga]|uniref:fungal-specific transcription factor domain-containing protein n=1 Tax=Lipomyces oligophaga TaxID=45792 RepID=UPI0034CFB020
MANREISPIPEYPRLRTRRACRICRRRKVKCDGVIPSCGQCSQRGALCVYRDDESTTAVSTVTTTTATASNTTLKRTGSVAESINGSASKVADGTEQKRSRLESAKSSTPVNDSQSPFHSTIYSGITATNPGVESFIYYGPASTFSFIQHIHQEINAGTIEMSGIGDVPEGIRTYGFRDLFLGWNVDRGSDKRDGPGQIRFLDPALAAKYIENFFRTLAYIMPVYTRPYIDSRLEALYSAKSPPHRGESALLSVLATGASLEGDSEWSSLLYERALGIVQATSEIISTDRVKVLLILSHLQAMSGKMNTAYTLSGQAVRLAYACGLHREFPSLSTYEHASVSSQDRKTTFWALYSFERLLAILLGRPSAFVDSEVDISLPDQDFLRYMAPLGQISTKSSNLIYSPRNKSVPAVWESACIIDAELMQYQKELPSTLQFEDFGKAGVVLHADAFVIGCHFFLFKTLTYRPFLLIDGLIRKHERQSCSSTSTSASASTSFESKSFLPEACHRAVEAGRSLLLLLARAYSSDPMLAKMRFNSIFLQTACAILLFDVLRDPTQRHEVMTNFEIINIALECYRLMKADVSVESGLAMIEQVQTRAKEAFEAANLERNQHTENSARSQNPDNESEPAVHNPPDGTNIDLFEQVISDIVDTVPPDYPSNSLHFSVPLDADTHSSQALYQPSNSDQQHVESPVSTGNHTTDSGNDNTLNTLWDSWDEGFDWLKTGFMLPNDIKPADLLK